MNCGDIQEQLTPFLLGDLDPVQADAIRRHLADCPTCRQAADELQAALGLLKSALSETPALPEKTQIERSPFVFASRPRPPIRVMSWVIKFAVAASIIFILSGLMLPNLGRVREKARRVNDLSNLNGVFKAAAAWGLDPADEFRPPFPPSLDELVKNKAIAPQMLISVETKKPIEYYPTTDESSDTPLLVSAGKHGRNVVKANGSGYWVEDGTPEAEKLTKQLADLRKQSGASASMYAGFSGKTQPAPIAEEFTMAMAGRSEFRGGSLAFDGESAGLGPPAPPAPMPKQAIAEKSTTAKQDVDTAVKSAVDASTLASAKQTAAARLTISAPSAYVQPSVQVDALQVAPPKISAVDIKIGSEGTKIAAAEVKRLMGVRDFQKGWVQSGTGAGGAGSSFRHGGGKAIRAKYAIYQAKYQGGDWNCNPNALTNLMQQIRAWSRERIDANLAPEVIDFSSEQVFTLRPPFVYLTGSRDFTLKDIEVRNMRDYLMVGGAIWADSAAVGKGSHFDVSFRREMHKVLPNRDFETVKPDHPMFDTFFQDIDLPLGWANSWEPAELINIGDELAVLYTLNNYGKLWTYRLDKDNHIDYALSPKATAADGLPTPEVQGSSVSDRLVVDAYKFGINVVVHLLTRYQEKFRFLPKYAPPTNSHLIPTAKAGGATTTNVPTEKPSPPREPAETNTPPVAPPVCRAKGTNPFVSAAEQPFSTFSIDVDTASYSLSRNYLQRGQLPPPEDVRTEEFVNYFEYNYAPPNGPTFAIYTDCGQSAFGRGLSLLKIGVKGRRLGREEKRPLVLTLLIDTSGSMATPDRLDLVKSALGQMVNRLNPADKVAIVQFDSHARLLLPHTPVAYTNSILIAIDRLQTSGSTALEEGMQLAYATAARGFNSAAINRILLLSDGMANLGAAAADDILKSVENYRKQGITISVFGFGLGAYNDAMLETLADKGDGVYAFIDSLDEARKVLADDLAATVNIIARDVKIQVEFNPKRVKQYRQLGYENRQLKKEEFRDDTVDAGEIGSGQSVTALYELELQGDPGEKLGTVRIRCRNALTGLIEEIEQPITLAAGAIPFDAMDARFRLAAAVAEFAEILRGSPFAAGSNFEDVARVLRPVALELSLDKRIQECLRLTQSGLTLKFQDASIPEQ